MSRTRRDRAALDRRVAKHRREGRPFGIAYVMSRALMYGPDFYDRRGDPLTVREYAALHQFRSYCRVAETFIGPLRVSTVWLGLDHRWLATPSEAPLPPVIFETMVFQKDRVSLHPELDAFVNYQERYCSEEDAETGHAEVCVDIRSMMAKIAMADEVHAQALTA